MQTPPNQTPIYKPNYHDQLSPRTMWKEETKEKKTPTQKAVNTEKPDPTYEDLNREAFKNLNDDEKNLLCAGIVVSNAWRKFLKPHLETFANPVRRRIKSDADYYQLLDDNAVASFVNELIATLEARARRSPSYVYTHDLEEELDNE